MRPLELLHALLGTRFLPCPPDCRLILVLLASSARRSTMSCTPVIRRHVDIHMLSLLCGSALHVLQASHFIASSTLESWANAEAPRRCSHLSCKQDACETNLFALQHRQRDPRRCVLVLLILILVRRFWRLNTSNRSARHRPQPRRHNDARMQKQQGQQS